MKLNKLLLAILLGLSFSCTVAKPVKVSLVLPKRPSVAACFPPIDMGGKLDGGFLMLPLEDAIKLRSWIAGGILCHEKSVAELDGHIEKLENRLKALSES